jgi:nitronate monooxygenase
MSTPNLTSRLGIQLPIVQAPMAGGPTPPALVAAVSNVGALGSLGAAYLSPEQIREAVAEIRRLTDRPFNVNLFVGGREPGGEVDPGPMLVLLARYHQELELPPPELPRVPPDPFEAQLEAVLELKVPVFSFTFGIPDEGALQELKRRGVFSIGTATTVAEAERLEAAGVDAIAAQGAEAGGHRGTFLGPFEAGLVGTLALVPQMVDAVSIPVLASGGIMDGRGIVAARALGAAGVQMGTAFLTTEECSIPEAFRARLREVREDGTAITRAFSGRPARGIVNRFLEDVVREDVPVLPFPLQNELTRPMRAAAARRGEADALSLWARQAARLGRRETAAALVERLVEESRRVVGELNVEDLP